MLAFLQVRHVIYSGGSWTQALEHVDIGAAVTEKAEQAEDNEYINNCQMISTIFQKGRYEYGTGPPEPRLALDSARDMERTNRVSGRVSIHPTRSSTTSSR